MKAAIFDVDGTLLDSMSVWEDIGERYLASQNITAEKNLRAALHTMSLEQGAAWMKEKYQLDKSISQIIEEVLKIVSDFYRFEAPLKPGVKKTLEWFKERNIQMTLALTGAVFGAFLSGVFYRASHGKIICAVIGEIFGTGIIGSLVSYPVMAFLMGRSGLNAFFYTPMFLAATCMGGTIAYFFLKALSHAGMLAKFQQSLGAKVYDRKSDKSQTINQNSTAADSLHH